MSTEPKVVDARTATLPRKVGRAARPGFRAWLSRAREGFNVFNAGMVSVAWAMILIALVTFVLIPHNLPPWRYYGTLLGLAALIVLYVQDDESTWPRSSNLRPKPLFYLILASVLVLAINMLGLDGNFSFLPYLLFLICGHTVSLLPLRYAVLYCTGLHATFLTLLAMIHGVPASELGDIALTLGVGMLFSGIFSLLAVRYSEENARAKQLLKELRVAREREKELAVVEERVRLAREIHDGLGHHLTVLNVQLQAAEKLIERDPQRAAGAIRTSREVARAALEEVRHSVASMRRSPLDGRSLDEALAKLVEDFDHHSALEAHFEQVGGVRPIDVVAATTLFRAAQEALTNVQKHSTASCATVTLHYTPATVTVTVSDDGTPLENPTTGKGGFGLAGLRERAEQLGGTFSSGAREGGGFMVEVSLPLETGER